MSLHKMANMQILPIPRFAMTAVTATRPEMPRVSASQLVAGMQKVSSAVMTHGAVVITKHDEPTMVLMSMDRFLKLEQAAAPNLDALTQQFDTLFARMQGDAAAQNMADAFAMSADELADAAVQMAR